MACEVVAARNPGRMTGPPALAVHDPWSAILAPGGGSDADGVAADAAAMQAFREADLRVGGGRLYAEVTHYLRAQVAPRLVMAAPGGDNLIIFTSAAAISEMAGWMAHDAGRDQVARRHFERALSLVTVSGDRQLRAHVLASIGHIAHHVDLADEAFRASQAGLEVLGPGPRDPELEARLLALRARAFAALGEPAEAARSLALAEKAIQAGRSEPRSEWVSGFDEGALASEAARCMRQLGQLSEARRQAERVIALRPADRPRSRAFGMFICAGVLAVNGKPDEAAGVAAEILQATDALGSYIVVQNFRGLRRLLEPYGSSTVVREFLARLDPALRQRRWLWANVPADGPASLHPANGRA
jgi:hypothetical protein